MSVASFPRISDGRELHPLLLDVDAHEPSEVEPEDILLVLPRYLRVSKAAPKVFGNLAQVMRGILFPNSNIIFDAQNTDPVAKAKKAEGGAFGNPYGGWQEVENAAIALAEVSNVLIIPGRVCSNGKPAPNNQPDWPKLVQGLRDAAMESYKAAQSKNMDKIVDAAGTLTEACSNCHDKYREKPNLSLRCTP